jgi:hypothetical protein
MPSATLRLREGGRWGGRDGGTSEQDRWVMARRQPGGDLRAAGSRSRWWAAGLTGVGLAGLVDVLVFQQLLGWRHFYHRSTMAVGLTSDGLLDLADNFRAVTATRPSCSHRTCATGCSNAQDTPMLPASDRHMADRRTPSVQQAHRPQSGRRVRQQARMRNSAATTRYRADWVSASCQARLAGW